MVPVASLAAMVCVGIGVDFSGQTLAEQDLRDLAAYCAREGAQEILLGASTAFASSDATYRCLSEYGMTGTVSVSDEAVTVNVTGTYSTQLLTLVAIDQLPIRAAASASILQGR